MIGGHVVMSRWETPLMRCLAQVVADSKRDVLEVGFGLGISADWIQHLGCSSHTVVEAHPEVAGRARDWARTKPNAMVVEGFWQDVIDSLGDYDAILFDTYPTSAEEFAYASQRFYYPFFPRAAEHLRAGGVFTYFTFEVDALAEEHSRRLLSHFDEVRLRLCRGLQPSADCDYWSASTMVVPEARKDGN